MNGLGQFSMLAPLITAVGTVGTGFFQANLSSDALKHQKKMDRIQATMSYEAHQEALKKSRTMLDQMNTEFGFLNFVTKAQAAATVAGLEEQEKAIRDHQWGLAKKAQEAAGSPRLRSDAPPIPNYLWMGVAAIVGLALIIRK